MPKAKFDKDAAFKKIIGADEEVSKEDINKLPEKKATEELKTKEQFDLGARLIPPKPKLATQKLKQRGFYITEEQYKALKLRAITSEQPEEKDTSAIVRNAIDLYLSKSVQS
jgi:hypothetical protein